MSQSLENLGRLLAERLEGIARLSDSLSTAKSEMGGRGRHVKLVGKEIALVVSAGTEHSGRKE